MYTHAYGRTHYTLVPGPEPQALVSGCKVHVYVAVLICIYVYGERERDVCMYIYIYIGIAMGIKGHKWDISGTCLVPLKPP